ncbi:hypothetical protein LTR94_032634, partial [Friedmanniomyces endolithicus]
DRVNQTNGSGNTSDKHSPGGGFLVSNRWDTDFGEMGALFDVAVNRDNWAFPVQYVDRPDNVFSVSPDGSATRLGNVGPYAPAAPGDVLGQLPNIGGIYNAGQRERQPARAKIAADIADKNQGRPGHADGRQSIGGHCGGHLAAQPSQDPTLGGSEPILLNAVKRLR